MSLQKELWELANENKLNQLKKEREKAEYIFENELKPKMLEAAAKGETYLNYSTNLDILSESLMNILKSEHIGVSKKRPSSSYHFIFKWDRIYYEYFDE